MIRTLKLALLEAMELLPLLPTLIVLVVVSTNITVAFKLFRDGDITLAIIGTASSLLVSFLFLFGLWRIGLFFIHLNEKNAKLSEDPEKSNS